MKSIKELSVGLFFGSDTGSTEEITQHFTNQWKLTELKVIEATDMTVEDYGDFDFIFIGLPTWYDGDLQSDFEDFYEQFLTIDFTGKIVAMYGLGDQYGYDEFFVDGLGILGEAIIKNGGKIIGMWPIEGYEFTESKGQFNDELFYGLAIDEDNQMDQTESRIQRWITQVEEELKSCLAEAST
ncbi:MAG: flavodoxin [Bacteroidota bacterium]